LTIRTRRRGRRSLAAIAAALLMASVLAVVAGAPAQAANTSSEVLVDTNDDGVGDAREFGGRDRYDTALRLAENFAAAKGGLGNVPVAFVASGGTLVDAVAVSGLAGYQDAPVLLTPTDSLHGGVADFIEDYGVDTVYVLGGSAAVADSVLEDIEALANEPAVTRIQGADRYATAAAIASSLGGGAAWCGGEDAAAILVNGGDSSLVDAMMVGPIANRLQLPVLMTAADELPSGTADFIEADNIEHVIIVGGADAVSEGIEDALADAGVDTVERIAGDTPAGTSVALAELAFDGCSDDLEPVSADTVALVHRDALPDGVAAAPVLAGAFDDGNLVPVLVVGDTLPAAVRDYLAGTAEEDAAGNKVNFNILAIGGTAAVSSGVMDAALAAAASAPALTVQIGNGGSDDGDAGTEDRKDVNEDGKFDANDVPQAGDDQVTLYFNDDVISDTTDLEAKIRDVITLNGAPARLHDTSTVVHTGSLDACNPDHVTVRFESPLKPGDTVAIAAGLKLGAAADQRTVGGASVTVPALVPDRTRPTVSVIMIAGRTTAEVTISEPEGAVLSADDIEVRSNTADQEVSAIDGTSGTITFAQGLVVGDRITIASGAVEDAAGNRSLQRSFTAIAAHKSPRITSVLMSNLKHSAQASTTVPTDITGSTDTGDEISISAKADGAAAGAVGNGWLMVFDVASSWKADPDAAVDIDVWVNNGDRQVSVRFNSGDATYGDLKAALEGNSAFDAMFEVGLPAVAGTCSTALDMALGLDATDRQEQAAPTTGGMTQVAIEVRFNGYVQTINASELLDDILADTAKRGDVASTVVATALGLGSAVDKADTTAPTTTHRFEAITANPAMLPQVRDLVTTQAGHAGQTAADPIPAIAAVTAVATGYATDPEAGAAVDNPVNEDKNGASQVRIGRSSNVMVPPTPSS